jgi:hypothetical protein
LKVEQRYNRIIEKASPLPANNQLKARSIYWFVTTEDVDLLFQDASLFVHKEKALAIGENGVTCFLNQVEFRKNKRGIIGFKFPQGDVEYIRCISTKPSSNKRAKVSSSPESVSTLQFSDEFGQMQIDDPQNAQVGVPVVYPNNNNTNQPQQLASSDPHSASSLSPPDSSSDVFEYPTTKQSPPRAYSNGMQVPASEPLIVNIILLVPDADKYIQMADRTLTGVGFTKEVSSTNQHLYSQKNLNNTSRHVLLLPYGSGQSLYKTKDFLWFASEVIWLIEDEFGGPNDMPAVERIVNVNYNPEFIWPLTVKTASFRRVELNYALLSENARLVLSIGELQNAILGGVNCTNSLNEVQLFSTFKNFFLQWTLALVESRVVQNIYLCFKFEPKGVRGFTEYAALTLAVLGIDCAYDPVVTNGSVLVYIRCPVYIPWYILARKDDIFDTLAEEGLKEIYECFISDVEVSMQRPDNEEFVDELTFLKELMISDGISELPKPSR